MNGFDLSARDRQELDEAGFTIIPGPVPVDGLTQLAAAYDAAVGSVWHRHAANRSDQPRRSIHGAYIRGDAESGENLPARMQPETLSRISPLAKYVLAV